MFSAHKLFLIPYSTSKYKTFIASESASCKVSSSFLSAFRLQSAVNNNFISGDKLALLIFSRISEGIVPNHSMSQIKELCLVGGEGVEAGQPESPVELQNNISAVLDVSEVSDDSAVDTKSDADKLISFDAPATKLASD